MKAQRELEESARRIKEEAERKAAAARKKQDRRRRFWQYVADKWIDFLALILAIIALVRTL